MVNDLSNSDNKGFQLPLPPPPTDDKDPTEKKEESFWEKHGHTVTGVIGALGLGGLIDGLYKKDSFYSSSLKSVSDTATNEFSAISNDLGPAIKELGLSKADYQSVSKELDKVTSYSNNAIGEINKLEGYLSYAKNELGYSKTDYTSALQKLESLKGNFASLKQITGNTLADLKTVVDKGFVPCDGKTDISNAASTIKSIAQDMKNLGDWGKANAKPVLEYGLDNICKDDYNEKMNFAKTFLCDQTAKPPSSPIEGTLYERVWNLHVLGDKVQTSSQTIMNYADKITNSLCKLDDGTKAKEFFETIKTTYVRMQNASALVDSGTSSALSAQGSVESAVSHTQNALDSVNKTASPILNARGNLTSIPTLVEKIKGYMNSGASHMQNATDYVKDAYKIANKSKEQLNAAVTIPPNIVNQIILSAVISSIAFVYTGAKILHDRNERGRELEAYKSRYGPL